MIAAVICTPELVFLVAETTDFPLVFATSSPPGGMLGLNVRGRPSHTMG